MSAPYRSTFEDTWQASVLDDVRYLTVFDEALCLTTVAETGGYRTTVAATAGYRTTVEEV